MIRKKRRDYKGTATLAATGYFTAEYYSQIIKAFQAIGDKKDADILIEAGRLDSYYQKLLDCKEDKNEFDRIYEEFSDKLDELEEDYTNEEFTDMEARACSEEEKTQLERGRRLIKVAINNNGRLFTMEWKKYELDLYFKFKSLKDLKIFTEDMVKKLKN